jgi:hypothetical protein
VQAADGQWLFLHPLNLRCLLRRFGSYAGCPPTVRARLLEIEDDVQVCVWGGGAAGHAGVCVWRGGGKD